MPIIEGGTYRVWSRTQDLQLSAEQSYDPNLDPHSQSLLHYHWDCQSTSKVGTGIKENLFSAVRQDGLSLSLPLTVCLDLNSISVLSLTETRDC